MTQTLVLIALYILVQLFISLWAARFINNSRDFMLAGQSIGLGVALFSLFATWFGAETLMGTAADVAQHGLIATRGDPLGYGLCLALMGLLVAYQLRQRSYTTVSDFYRDRFCDRTSFVVTLVMLPTSLLWAATQFLAFGYVLAAVTQASIASIMPLAAGLIVAYTLCGGLLGDVSNDMLRGSVLIIGLLITVIFVALKAGGAVESFNYIKETQLTLTDPGESFLTTLDAWMVPILGSLVAQEALSRLLATSAAKTARRACFIAAGLYITVGLIPVYMGLVGAHLTFPRTTAEEFMPELARHVLPEGFYIFFIGALLSAILSTVQSTLLTFSTLAANNVIFPACKSLSETAKLHTNRLLTFAAGAVSYALAVTSGSIRDLADLSSSFGSTGILVTFFLGLWWKKGSSAAALATLTAGLLFSALTSLIDIEAPFLTGLVICSGVYGVMAVIDGYRRPRPCR